MEIVVLVVLLMFAGLVFRVAAWFLKCVVLLMVIAYLGNALTQQNTSPASRGAYSTQGN